MHDTRGRNFHSGDVHQKWLDISAVRLFMSVSCLEANIDCTIHSQCVHSDHCHIVGAPQQNDSNPNWGEMHVPLIMMSELDFLSQMGPESDSSVQDFLGNLLCYILNLKKRCLAGTQDLWRHLIY